MTRIAPSLRPIATGTSLSVLVLLVVVCVGVGGCACVFLVDDVVGGGGLLFVWAGGGAWVRVGGLNMDGDSGA